MAKVKTFKTIFPAVSVPLNEDYSINEQEFRVYLRWIKSFYGKGIEGLVCNGHTGEITGLTRAERKRVTEICAEECGDVMTIISGVNCENTQESIEMAAEAKEAGADGILLMPPHMWLRFGMNPNAPFQYVKDVAEGADIDIIIHLYPATSKAFYPVETLIKMCKEIDHVKCIKMGTRVTSIYEHDVRLLRQECPDISLITCHDETLCVSWFPGMDGALIGFAGCSADCDTMWQIGIDVLPAYRRQGVAAALTARLALECLARGKVPFYCAAWSNIPSVRNAIRAGFRPAWVELTTKSIEAVNDMNA